MMPACLLQFQSGKHGVSIPVTMLSGSNDVSIPATILKLQQRWQHYCHNAKVAAAAEVD